MIPNKETRALARNLTTFDLWFEHLSLLAVSSIEWTLPKTVDTIYLERELFYNTQVITFIADESLVALAGFGSSKPNLYGIPLKRIVNAKNGFTATLDNENSVIIYNNTLRRNGARIAQQYALRLAQLDRVIDLNTEAQKTPYIIRATKESELSVRNAYGAIDNNEAYLAVTDDFREDAIQVLKTDAPFTAPQIRALQESILAEYVRSLGFAGVDDKAERFISSEVAARNSGVLVYREARMKPRRQACEEINRRFAKYLDEPADAKFVGDMLDYTLPNFRAQEVVSNG